MVKSKIFTDIYEGKIDTSQLIRRLKILIHTLDHPELKQWIEHEINGYSKSDTVPEYRKMRGTVIGSFMCEYQVYSSAPIPVSLMKKEDYDLLTIMNYRKGIGEIERYPESEQIYFSLNHAIPIILFELSEKTTITSIIEANLSISSSTLKNILSVLQNIILDILLILEDTYGNLDEIDLTFSKENNEKIIPQVNQILINNGVIMGSNNQITKSDIIVKDTD